MCQELLDKSARCRYSDIAAGSSITVSVRVSVVTFVSTRRTSAGNKKCKKNYVYRLSDTRYRMAPLRKYRDPDLLLMEKIRNVNISKHTSA